MKNKGGRPPRADDPARIAILLPRELKTWLRIYALQHETSAGAVVEQLVRELRKKEGKK